MPGSPLEIQKAQNEVQDATHVAKHARRVRHRLNKKLREIIADMQAYNRKHDENEAARRAWLASGGVPRIRPRASGTGFGGVAPRHMRYPELVATAHYELKLAKDEYRAAERAASAAKRTLERLTQ